MKIIYLRCKDCNKITMYLDEEDDNSSDYKTCTFHGKHKRMEVIGSEEASEYICRKRNIKNRDIESLEEIEKIMTEKTGIKEIIGRD